MERNNLINFYDLTLKKNHMRCKQIINIETYDNYIIDRFCCGSYPKEKLYTIEYFLNNQEEVIKKMFADKKYLLRDKFYGECISKNRQICNRLVDLSLGFTVDIATLTRCNAKCNCCPSKLKLDHRQLDKDLEIKITKSLIEEISKLDYLNQLELTGGGEFTIYPVDFLLENISNKLKELIILSNGSNIKALEYIINKFEKSNTKLIIRISMPSFRKDILEDYYKLNHYDNLINFLETTKFKNIEINYICFDETMDDFYRLYQFCKNHNFKMNITPNKLNMSYKVLDFLYNLQNEYTDCEFWM